MLRALSAVGVLLSCAGLVGCGSSSQRASPRVIGGPPVRLTPPSPTALRFSTASNRRFAYQDVQRLIGILELPRGARLVARVPTSVPLRFRHGLTRARFAPGVAVTHRIWIVHKPLDRVVRFVRAHAHPRPRPEARYRGTNNGIRLRAVGSYQFPPVPGRSWERWLNADMVALGGGGTAVIAQSGDAWIHTLRRAPLPRAVKRIDVVSRIGNHPPNVLVHVREPYEVGWMVALVNGLGRSAAKRIACLAFLHGGPTVTLRFRAANGKLLARAAVPDTLGIGRSGPCNPVQLTVRSRKTPPLIGADVLLRMQRLLGVDLAPPLPRDVSACLERRDWKVRSISHNKRVGRGQSLAPELTATNNRRRWTITFRYTGKVTLDKPGPPELERCLARGRGYVIAG